MACHKASLHCSTSTVSRAFGFFRDAAIFFHPFVDCRLKVFLATLLTHARWDVLNNLKPLSPTKIYFHPLLNHSPFAKVTFSHCGSFFVFSNHFPTPEGPARKTLLKDFLPW
jgi:hypothetical protein